MGYNPLLVSNEAGRIGDWRFRKVGKGRGGGGVRGREGVSPA